MGRRSLVLAALLATACGHVETRLVRLGPPATPLPDDAPVAVYQAPLSGGEVRGREVALVELTGYGDRAEAAELLPTLRDLARSVGADAVVWLREDTTEGFLRVIASAVRTGGR